jgi:hypothetical protein
VEPLRAASDDDRPTTNMVEENRRLCEENVELAEVGGAFAAQ